MKLRPLLITPAACKDVVRVMKFALEHPLNVHDLFAIKGGRQAPPGDDPQRVCIIPVGYRCVYTLEDHGLERWRHLSVSIPAEEKPQTKGPHPGAVVMLALAFGFDLTQGVTPEQALADFGKAFPKERTACEMEGWGQDQIAVNLMQKAAA